MPRTQRQRTDGMTGDYPADWPEIAERVKAAADWKCVRCGHDHDPEAFYTLTVHHLDMNKANCDDWNLAALCQRCHLSVQGRVDFSQRYMLDHSDWMKPYIEGFKRAMGIGGANG